MNNIRSMRHVSVPPRPFDLRAYVVFSYFKTAQGMGM